ncbi:AMP-binding protein [Planotetraspora sp. A-T 1434]|uniref:AMP-binding protein n=1 Tax=Planotetraspora sp. A-T 1434 TaxID=2979219 RepID=UPI0021BF94B6|nr:AMP-binding protein [Planotetraspora sp. A-T 1434]MCT9933159.1 AMP-binding protein [Planotetraspora sp. A-T 1434]
MQAQDALLGWISDPDPSHGIRFADPGGGWDLWPYPRLAALARSVAAALRERSVGPGDVVSIVQHSGPHFVGTLFGAMLAGATPSPIAPPQAFGDRAAYQAHLTGLLATAKPALLVTDLAVAESLAGQAGTIPLLPVEKMTASSPGEPSFEPAMGELALLQFTSGSSGPAGAVEIPYSALAANVASIRAWLRMTPDDATASWLPVHHDMGLIGCLITPIVNGSDLWLMRPEDFVRDPARYLRCFGESGAVLTSMPNFGLGYVARRVTPEKLRGMDFSALRTVIVGAERVDDAALERFCALLGPYGLDRRALQPAYGLAEATLAVTGLDPDEEWTTLRVRPRSLRVGGRIERDGTELEGADLQPITGCGRPLPGVQVTIEDDDGRALGEDEVGEIVVRGPNVARGHEDGLRTADAGFVHDGQLYVIGRLGDSLKLRGRALFAEDLELALSQAGVPPLRMAALLGHRSGVPTVAVVFEQARAEWLAAAGPLLRRRAEGAEVVFFDAPRGSIARTSSGKPKRRRLWRDFAEDRLPGTVIAEEIS